VVRPVAGFKSNVAGRFPEGAKLRVYARLSDTFGPAAGDPVKGVSVDKDGGVSVSGLVDGAPYWLADAESGRAISFTAKESAGKVQSPLSQLTEARGGPVSAAPGRNTEPNVITGARGSGHIKARHQPVLLSEDRQVRDAEPQPHVAQQDVKGVPQRSDTAFGQATPTDPGESQPRVSQDEVPKRAKQRSDTELGEATLVPEGEVEPFVAQGDVPRGTRQRSDTELGSAEPVEVPVKSKPKAREAEKARDSSETKAEGGTEQQSVRQVSRKRAK
jgi:hypothetical protein